MNLIPKSVTRLAGRSSLKLQKASPTILVVGGVVGLAASAVLAAKATRKIDPIIDNHKATRDLVEQSTYPNERAKQQALARTYSVTGWELTKLYGPALFIGSASAVAILGGHKILRTRHVATLAAYSGLGEQFASYRARVAKTLGVDAEKDIYNGAHGEYKEDPDHPGEYKLGPVYSDEPEVNHLRPWYNELVPGWTEDPVSNEMKLRGLQAHYNTVLDIRGYVFLNDIYDALHIPRTSAGQVVGWLREGAKYGGDGFIDFGISGDVRDPNTIAFLEQRTPEVQLNFNVDPGTIWDKIDKKNR